MLAASIGMTVQVIPSFVISIVIRHIIGIGIIIMPPGMPMPDNMPGIIPGIMPPIPIGIIGMPPMPMDIIGIGIGAIIGMDIGIPPCPPAIIDMGMGMAGIDICMGIGRGIDMGIIDGIAVMGALLPLALEDCRGLGSAEHGRARPGPRLPAGAPAALSSAGADPRPRFRAPVSGG
jgi:hypothetical protein